MNLIKAHRELAEKGFHWLMVRGDDEALLKIVADAVQPFGAQQAQHYGRFIIEELIDPPGSQPQVAESPDVGSTRRHLPRSIDFQAVVRAADAP